ncbi:hypothetical protein EIP86_005375 [Pleurotus ostreatoroseus]|nr:hypothetical protein EIP86_005375 [Pleurotus ostreatoroseus]
MDHFARAPDSAQSSTLVESTETDSNYVHTNGLDTALASAGRRALHYEVQMKDLETKLAEHLSNSRAIDNILREVVQSLHRRSSAALTQTVPYISHALQDDLAVLQELGEQLPEVGLQVKHIREVYDRGRGKAQELVKSLEWLNTPVPRRLRTIIFTPDAPVSRAWKAAVRVLFAVTFLACMWIMWITLRGAVRAHRERLVWGTRLMS